MAEAVSGSTLGLTAFPLPMFRGAGEADPPGFTGSRLLRKFGRSFVFSFLLRSVALSTGSVEGKDSNGGSSSIWNRLAIPRRGDSSVGLVGPSIGGRGVVAKP